MSGGPPKGILKNRQPREPRDEGYGNERNSGFDYSSVSGRGSGSGQSPWDNLLSTRNLSLGLGNETLNVESALGG
jgi:hypothetical protein